MEIKLILLLVLSLSLIIAPSAVGVHILREWRSESRRLERRFRDLEW